MESGQTMTASQSLAQGQVKLTRLWFVWSGLLFTVVLIQSVGGSSGVRTADVWGWFTPLVLPTLSVIIGVLVSPSKTSQPEEPPSRTIFALAFWLSAFYLTIVTLTILLGPAAWISSGTLPVDFMAMSKLWLLPVQSLVTGALAAFFVSRR